MPKPKRNLGKRSSRALRPYIAVVTGIEAGVQFRVMYKRIADAERDAIKLNGTLEDLRTGSKRRWFSKLADWREVT